MSAGDTLQGRRVANYAEAWGTPGSYFKIASGGWRAVTPSGDLANLDAHEVIEHEDGTITVSPSISLSWPPDNREVWHGYLEKGVWREC